MQRVAIFDIDGTVFRSSLLIELVEALVTADIFPKSIVSEYEPAHIAWLNREGTYEDYIDAMVQAYMSNIKGVHYSDFKDVSDAVIETESKKVYRYTRDLIPTLKKKGYFLLAISQSPKTIVDGFAKSIGFDKVYGRMYELGPQDRFTGEMIDVHLIVNKANIVKRAVDKEELTLEGSVGVGDTEGDVSFLELVETPICFNPNQNLYKEAKRRGWDVVVERKDVIYEL